MASNNIDFTIYFRNAAQVSQQVAGFRAEMIKTAEAITNAKNRIDQINASLRNYEKELKDGTINKSKYTKETAALNKELSKQQQIVTQNAAAMEKAAKSTQAATNSTKGFNAALRLKNALMQNSIYLLTRWFGAFAAVSLITNTIKIIADYEKELKTLQAVLGDSSAEAEATMERLGKVAQEAAASGIFATKEVIQMQVELAKLGFSADEIEASTKAIVQLAVATGESLANSAEIAASVIRGFTMDASEMADIADIMAFSFNTSALSLDRFRESIKYVAPIADKLGWSFKEVAVLMSVLSNNVVYGSLAGTGLRNVMKAMADQSSALQKAMGGNVITFEDFLDGLEKLKTSGFDLEDTFEVIELRTTTLLQILIENIDAIRILNKAFDEQARGSSMKMYGIMMDSLSSQASRLKNNWQNFILSLQDSGGALRWIVERLADVLEVMARINAETEKTGIDELFRENLAKQINDALNTRDIQKIESLNKALLERIDISNKALEAARKVSLVGMTENEMDVVRSNYAFTLSQHNILLDEYERFKTLWERMRQDESEINEKENSRLAALYRAQHELNVAMIKAKYALFEEERLLADENRRFNDQMNRLLVEDEETLNILLKAESIKHKSTLDQIVADERQFWTDISFEVDKGMNEFMKKFIESIEKSDAERKKQLEAARKARLELFELDEEGEAFDIPWDTAEFVKGLDKTSDELEKFATNLYNISDLIAGAFKDIADAQVDSIDRIVDRYDQMVEETQRALEIETELFAAGYASNVTLKKQELEQLQAQREVALQQQREFVKQQQQIETVVQAINMASSVAGILKDLTTKLGVVGLIAAPAAVAALFALWKNAKVKAIESAYTFGEGGWIEGQPHSKGGKWINAEGGEYIVNKKSSEKFAPLLEAMNSGKRIPLEFMLDHNLIKDLDSKQHGLEIMQHKVSFDDGKAQRELKAIRQLLSNKNGTEYRNGYRIEKIGSRTRKIYDN